MPYYGPKASPPLHVADHALSALSDFDEDDRVSLLRVLAALLTKHRAKALAGEAS